MAIALIDGTGTGNKAKVNNANRLETSAITSTEEHQVSHLNGQAYVANTVDTEDLLTITATGGLILFIQNDNPTKVLVIEGIAISSDASTKVKFFRNMTVGAVGNENDHQPVNLNFGSSNMAEATVYSWDEVGNGITGITGGQVISTRLTGVGSTNIDVKGTLVLAKNNNLGIELTSLTTTDECSIDVRMYYADPES